MPTAGYVEKTIFDLEGIRVDFIKDKKNLRSEVQLPRNYSAERQTKNSANVAHLILRLQSEFPGYDFKVYDGKGNKSRGNVLLGNLRDTYE